MYDFERDLPAGVRCTFTLRDGLRSLGGEPVSGPSRFAFSTGGPAIESTLPGEGSDRIEEEQAFVLGLDGEAARDSVLAHAGFEVEGVAERVGVELIEGEARDQLIANLPYWLRPDGPAVVLEARQAFPNEAKVRLIWGAGIASPSGVATEQEQVLEYRVAPARSPPSCRCERENAKADCIPLTPMRVRLLGAGGLGAGQAGRAGRCRRRRAQADDARTTGRPRHQLEFAPPFPESATLPPRASRPTCATTPAARSPTATRRADGEDRALPAARQVRRALRHPRVAGRSGAAGDDPQPRARRRRADSSR